MKRYSNQGNVAQRGVTKAIELFIYTSAILSRQSGAEAKADGGLGSTRHQVYLYYASPALTCYRHVVSQLSNNIQLYEVQFEE